MSAALVVLAKAPRPGRAKTRLCPPCTPVQAAELARAALADTLHTVIATPAARHVLVLDGEPGPWLPAGFELVSQRGAGLAERLGNAFADVGGAVLLVGMDTPQLTSDHLREGVRRLLGADTDAVLGPAPDGGYWAVGLRRPEPGAFAGVPMSTADTFRRQRERLTAHGLRVALLPTLRDVDELADARVVAALAPGGRFARALVLAGLA